MMRWKRGFLFLSALLLIPVCTVFADSCKDAIEKGKHHFGRYHLGSAEFDQAVSAYLEAAKDPACAYEAYWRLAELRLNWGTIQKVKKDKLENFRAGILYAEQAIGKNPKGAEGHFQYCVNQGSIIDIDGVMKNILKVRKIKKANDTALAVDPGFAPALVVDGRFDIDLPGLFSGDKKRGEEQLRKAVRAAPNYETAYTELASFLINEKRYKEAGEILGELMAPSFKHEFAAPWLTIDKPKAEELLKRILAAEESK